MGASMGDLTQAVVMAHGVAVEGMVANNNTRAANSCSGGSLAEAAEAKPAHGSSLSKQIAKKGIRKKKIRSVRVIKKKNWDLFMDFG